MKKKRFVLCIIIFALLICGVLYCINLSKDDTLEIHIGYQSITAQTWGALVIKNQQIFEDKLKDRYPDKNITVYWHDEVSGAVINNNMLAHKYQLGYMGDMPCIINLANSYKNEDYNSALLAFDGKGIDGINQSILVTNASGIDNINDLIGETISVPIGSSTHRMLLAVLEQNNLLDEVEIVHQDVSAAYGLLQTGKIMACAAWEPYPTYLSSEFDVTELINGQISQMDYLAGVMVDSDWAAKYPEICELFLESMEEAHYRLDNDIETCVNSICIESGFEKEIVKKVLQNICWETNITAKDVTTMQDNYVFLKNIGQIDEFPFKEMDWYISEQKGQ